MSKRESITVKCPNCVKEMITIIWDSINVDLNPEEKQKILDGTFFQTVCENCLKTFQLDYPCLYHDMGEQTMIQYVDDIQGAKECVEMVDHIRSESGSLMNEYRIRIVLRQRDLIEKVKVFEAGYDDRVILIMKAMVYVMVDSENKDFAVRDIFFEKTDPGFRLVAVSENDELATANFTDKMYDDVAKDYADKIESTEPVYYIYDIDWAWRAIKQS